MQIVENWSDVEGEVKHLSPYASDPSFAVARVKVDAAVPVGSFANLVSKNVGNEIELRVPVAAVERLGLAPGNRLRVRVRQAGVDKYFSHPETIEKVP
jgi:hypothetical protein